MTRLTLVGWMVLLPVLVAQAAPDRELPSRVTWPEFVEIIRARSPRLRAAQAVARTAQAEVDVALRIPNPVVSYLGYGRLSGTSQAINGSQHQVQVEQEIPLWGQRRARGEAARAGAALAGQNAEKLANDVFVEARLTFVALLTSQARHARLLRALQQVSELRALIEGRVKTGLLGGFDLQRISLEVKRFELATNLSRVRVERLSGELAALVDAPAWLPEVAGDLTVAESRGGRRENVSPQVSLARAREQAARLNVELIGRERLPALTLTAGAYLTTAGDSTSLLGGLSLPIPSFDTGDALEERARRESAAASAELAATAAANEAQRAVAARERSSLQKASEAFAEGTAQQLGTLHEMAEQSYRAGTMGLSVLLDTLRAELEVELESLEAVHELLVADVRERALSGRVLEP